LFHTGHPRRLPRRARVDGAHHAARGSAAKGEGVPPADALGRKAIFYKTCELARVPYPVRYAFANVYTQRPVPTPVIHVVNRLFVVQYRAGGGTKTLLFSPSDVLANAETRYFKPRRGSAPCAPTRRTPDPRSC
jgi:hypothetical protein